MCWTIFCCYGGLLLTLLSLLESHADEAAFESQSPGDDGIESLYDHTLFLQVLIQFSETLGPEVVTDFEQVPS